MSPLVFVLILGAALAALLGLAFRVLPRERWQIAAAIPLAPDGEGGWRGMNLTWYGLLQATALMAAAACFLFLLGSLSLPIFAGLALLLPLLSLCLPAARLVARVVEKKPFTFTVGGASFVGLILAPLLAGLVRATLYPELAIVPAMAALSIAYALGEGLGRLACISFGCCYGRPLHQCGPVLRRIFTPLAFTFEGQTKKIAYESGLAGRKVVPVQALTATLYCAAALLGIYLFLERGFLAALLVAVGVTQLWRAGSEFLRADYRGGGRVSAYQIMAVLALAYTLATALWLGPGQPAPDPDLGLGLALLWDPALLLGLQALWLTVLIYTGRSRVTAAHLHFHVVRENV